MGSALESEAYRTKDGRLELRVEKDPQAGTVTIDVQHEDKMFGDEVLDKVFDVLRTFSTDLSGVYEDGKFPLSMKTQPPPIDGVFEMAK